MHYIHSCVIFNLFKSKFNIKSKTLRFSHFALSGIVVESSQTQTASQYVETHINICTPESIANFDKHPKILNLVCFPYDIS